MEVRFEGLTVEADVVVGARGLPSVGNSFRATADVRCSMLAAFAVMQGDMHTCSQT